MESQTKPQPTETTLDNASVLAQINSRPIADVLTVVGASVSGYFWGIRKTPKKNLSTGEMTEILTILIMTEKNGMLFGMGKALVGDIANSGTRPGTPIRITWTGEKPMGGGKNAMKLYRIETLNAKPIDVGGYDIAPVDQGYLLTESQPQAASVPARAKMTYADALNVQFSSNGKSHNLGEYSDDVTILRKIIDGAKNNAVAEAAKIVLDAAISARAAQGDGEDVHF